MREALSGLTVRGRAFVAAGVTAILWAVLLGQDALTRVGVLVLALPLVTAYVLGRSRYRLALVRTLSPQIVAAGQPARLNLTLTNEGKTPSGALLLRAAGREAGPPAEELRTVPVEPVDAAVLVLVARVARHLRDGVAREDLQVAGRLAARTPC